MRKIPDNTAATDKPATLPPTHATRSPAAGVRGRPRQFDTEQALDRAMQVFRTKGYHAASVADLAADMGLTVGSIYKAFRDKQTLFLQVFERYLSKRHQQTRQALDANQTRIAAFIRTGQEDGSVDPGLNAEHTALLMLALLQGMRVVGKAGRQREEMMAVAALVSGFAADRHLLTFVEGFSLLVLR